jgi:hypothetical protein
MSIIEIAELVERLLASPHPEIQAFARCLARRYLHRGAR